MPAARVRIRREPRARLGGAGALRALRVLLVVTLAALAGCGQRGPLTLPDSARPIQRIDPAAEAPAGAAQPGDTAPPGGTAPAAPGAATGTTPPAEREPGTDDDGSRAKARQSENER